MEPLRPELVRWVLSRADLPIDTRLDFGLVPRKLNLNFKNFFRTKLVYDNATQTLWDFRPLPEFYMKRKNLKFSCFRSPGQLHVFNMGWEPYDMTIYGAFKFGPRQLSNHLVIRDEIKFLY